MRVEKGSGEACERQRRNCRRTQPSRGDLALHGTNDSSYSHDAPTPSPRCLLLNRLPLPQGATSLQYALSQGKNVVDHVEPPTIFHDRNLILSDVNQRRREHSAHPAPLLLFSTLFSTRPFILLPFGYGMFQWRCFS